jgi:6-phosphogluconolactonase/glucosamine-6-phosphate isomerase/deaminase
MRIYRAADYNDMSRKAANILSAQVMLNPHCVLGLATGAGIRSIMQARRIIVIASGAHRGGLLGKTAV